MTRPAMTFTKSEKTAIDAAFNAIEYLASTTNWTDSPQWREAFKLCRKDSESQTEARARISRAWEAGACAIDMDQSITHFPIGYAQHYILAFMLGMRHAMERSTPNTYCGEHYIKARELCRPAALEAYDAAQWRWLAGE